MGKSNTHDNAVRREARSLSKRGYDVRADVPGYTRPDRVCHQESCGIPDIVAQKGGRTVIREIETSATYGRDRGQRDIFSGYARGRSRTSFGTKVV